MVKGKSETGIKSSKEQSKPKIDIKTAKHSWLRNSLLAARLWYLGALLSFWSFGYTVLGSSDLWWHIATGRWIIEHRSLPLTDPWSFTRAGLPWLQHEWLSDVIYQGWITLFGLRSLVYWKWSVLLLSFLLLFAIVRQLAREPISSYCSVLLAVAVAAPFLDLRPHLYTLLGYILLLYVALVRKRLLPFLPLLFLIWVNLHAGFFWGIIALSILLLASLISSPWKDRKRLIIIWALCVFVCLFNPNGASAFTYPLKYAFDSSSPFKSLAEWLPPFTSGGIDSPLYPYGIAVFIIAGLFSALSGAYRRQKGIPIASLGLGLLTLAMSLTSRRFIPLFAISEALLVAPVLAHLLTPYAGRIPDTVAPVIAIVIGVIWMIPYPIAPHAFHYLASDDNFPIETCNFIDVNQLNGNIFAHYRWGGYLNYRTDGRMKVYIDSRADTVYDDQTYLRYATVQHYKLGWSEIIENSGAQYILWPRSREGQQMSQMLSSGRWRLLYDDFISVLLVRTDQQLPEQLKATSDSAYRRLRDGIQNLEQRRYVEAESSFQSALYLMPHLEFACYSLAQVKSLQGNKQEARAVIDECQKRFPNPVKLKAYEEFLK